MSEALEPFILPHFIAVENRVGFRAILGAELTALRGTDLNIDIGYEVHENSLFVNMITR